MVHISSIPPFSFHNSHRKRVMILIYVRYFAFNRRIFSVPYTNYYKALLLLLLLSLVWRMANILKLFCMMKHQTLYLSTKVHDMEKWEMCVCAILSLENWIEELAISVECVCVCYFIFYSILCKIVFWNDMTWDDYSHIHMMNMMTMMLPPKKQYKACCCKRVLWWKFIPPFSVIFSFCYG